MERENNPPADHISEKCNLVLKLLNAGGALQRTTNLRINIHNFLSKDAELTNPSSISIPCMSLKDFSLDHGKQRHLWF